MASWAFHLHLIAAISWIGGSVFMFALGVSMRDKAAQKKVYPIIGPIFGWFELGALILLLLTGAKMGMDYGLFDLMASGQEIPIAQAVTKKAMLVLVLSIVTIVHFFIAYRTNDRPRTKMENMLSRASSMLILLLNLFVMHYAILLRDIL